MVADTKIRVARSRQHRSLLRHFQLREDAFVICGTAPHYLADQLARSFRDRARFELDWMASMVSIEHHGERTSTFATYYWTHVKLYEFLYGIELLPRANENWQAWEARTGERIGLEVVRIAITENPNASPQPIDAHFVFTPDGLRDGLRCDVVPRLHRVRPRPKPDMLPGPKRFFSFLKSAGKTLLRTLIVVAAFVSVAVIAAFVFFPLETMIAVAMLAGLHGVSYRWRRWRP